MRKRLQEGDIKTMFIYCAIFYCDDEFIIEAGHRFRVRTHKKRWGRKLDFTQFIGPIDFTPEETAKKSALRGS